MQTACSGLQSEVRHAPSMCALCGELQYIIEWQIVICKPSMHPCGELQYLTEWHIVTCTPLCIHLESYSILQSDTLWPVNLPCTLCRVTVSHRVTEYDLYTSMHPCGELQHLTEWEIVTDIPSIQTETKCFAWLPCTFYIQTAIFWEATQSAGKVMI